VFRYRWVAAFVLTAAAAVLTAAIIGDRSTTDYGDGLDYMMRPISVSRELGVAIVIVSILGYVAGAICLLRFAPSEDCRERLAHAWLMSTLAGIVLGVAYRIVTAGVIGANIGGGLTVWVAVPLSTYLIVRAAKALAARPAVERERPASSA